MFPIIDVTDWKSDRPETMGRKEKEWRIHPETGKRWLFKLCRHDERTGVYAGEDWSEKIASEIAEVLGILHAIVELAEREGKPGIITLDFVTNRRRHRLTHGNELMAAKYGNYPAQQKRGLSMHTVANVMNVLSEPFIHRHPSGNAPSGVVTANDLFTGYLMLDALIGNTDRHHENWAILERMTGSSIPRYAELAPTFDHASSLGRELTDQTRQQGLSGHKPTRSPKGYVAKSRSAFYSDSSDSSPISPLAAFQLAGHQCPNAAKAWLERLESISASRLEEIVRLIPDTCMSALACDFAIALLELNRIDLLAK